MKIYMLKLREGVPAKYEEHLSFVTVASGSQQARKLVKEYLIEHYGRLCNENLRGVWVKPALSTCRAIGDSYIATPQVLVAENRGA